MSRGGAGCVTSAKGPATRGKAPLQLNCVGASMERIAVDIAGLFPTISSGVAMDHSTRWPEAYAIQIHEAPTIAEVLVKEFFARFGVPWELHSNQEWEFEASVFQECCQLMGIQKIYITPLCPQLDGIVERFNHTLT